MTDDGLPEPRLDRWEARTGWPLTGAAVLFLVAYAWPILDTRMPAGRARALSTFGVMVWVMFGLDYLIRFRLAIDRRRDDAEQATGAPVLQHPLGVTPCRSRR